MKPQPAELSSACTLAELLHDITSHAGDLELGLWSMRADPCADKISDSHKQMLVAAAIADGRAQAALVRKKFPNTDPSDIAHALGITVEHMESENRRGDILYFADYGGKPPDIRVYDGSVAIINTYLAQADVAAMFGVRDATPTFVAHEIYHHLDTLRPRSISQQHRVTTLKIGNWHLTSGLSSLAEIAANVFAQHLLALKANLALFEVIAMYAQSPRRARVMVNESRSIACAVKRY